MVTCMTEFFLWSLKTHGCATDDVTGLHTYHEKTQVSAEQPYLEEKQQHSEGQDIAWTPKNKRPEKLRDTLREVEELLSQFRVVQIKWRNRRIVQTVLSNLTVVTYVISSHSGDVEKIFVDKSMTNKTTTDLVSDAHVCEEFFITSYLDRHKIDYAYFTKRPPIGETIKRLEKISVWEPKISQIEIPGPIGRRLDRKISVNTRHDMILIWWTSSSEEAMPWSPMSSDKERANLVVLSTHGPNVNVLTYTRTECDLLSANFSVLQPHRCFTLEHTVGAGGDPSAQTCTYEIIRGKIQRISVTSIPLKGAVLCQCRNANEDKLVLGCGDGSLILLDEHRRSTLMARTSVVVTDIAWHPTETIFFVISSRGDIQVFDLALTPLRIQLVAEEPQSQRVLQLGKYFSSGLSTRELKWCTFDPQSAEWTGDYTDVMFVHLDRGPPAVMLLHLGVVSRERFSSLELVKEYLKINHTEQALKLLENMNWDTHGSMSYSCLSAIVNYLLRKPLNAERESQLEVTLGTFYAPKKAISELVIMDYRDPISRLARRFFHHLLRYSRFDKAFLLAVDIGARDLFMDIHYMASDKGETALAEVAKKKADQIEKETLDSIDGLDDDLVMNGFDMIDKYTSNHNAVDQSPWHFDNRGQDDLQLGHYPGSNHHHNQSAPLNIHHFNNGSHDTHGIEVDLIQDYTQALQLDDPSWIHRTSYIDAHQEEQEVQNNDKDDPDDVIHFGVV